MCWSPDDAFLAVVTIDGLAKVQSNRYNLYVLLLCY